MKHGRESLTGGFFLLAVIAAVCVAFIGFAKSPETTAGAIAAATTPQPSPGMLIPATLPTYISQHMTIPTMSAVMPTAHPAGVADGVQGIKPRTTSSDAKTPTYTEQDVRDYFTTRGLSAAAITNVAFQTVGQVNQGLGGSSLNFPGDMLVSMAQVNGSFTQQSKTADGYGTPRTFTKRFYVFDGHTGNLLMVRTAP